MIRGAAQGFRETASALVCSNLRVKWQNYPHLTPLIPIISEACAWRLISSPSPRPSTLPQRSLHLSFPSNPPPLRLLFNLLDLLLYLHTRNVCVHHPRSVSTYLSAVNDVSSSLIKTDRVFFIILNISFGFSLLNFICDVSAFYLDTWRWLGIFAK